MLVNRSKSGILVFDGPQPSPTQTLGFPIVDHYRYLGCEVTRAMSLADHVGALKGKLHYIRGQLAPILWQASPRFSASLFRTLAMPLCRLVMPLYDLTGLEDQNAYRIAIRRSFRGFLSLPRSTPNRIVEGILGDLGPLAQGVG